MSSLENYIDHPSQLLSVRSSFMHLHEALSHSPSLSAMRVRWAGDWRLELQNGHMAYERDTTPVPPRFVVVMRLHNS